MKKWIITVSILLAASFASAENVERKIALARARAQGVDSLIVVFKETDSGLEKRGAGGYSTGFQSIGKLKKLHGTSAKKGGKRTGRKVGRAERNLNNMYMAEPAAGFDLEKMMAEIADSPLVEYAEPNYKVYPSTVPNDEQFSYLWGLNNTGQVARFYRKTAYETTNGTPDADMDWLELWESAGFPTNEVVVAVIDTGVDYTHEDLTNQMWRNEAELNGLPGVDDDGNDFIDDIYGYDFLHEDADPVDDHGHGTHCAGTIAAEGNNGVGIIGINPYAKIMALKFLGSEGGSVYGGISSMMYAADNGADLISNSWGGGGYSQAMQDAIDYALARGCVVVFAAGNDNMSQPSYPAANAGTIAVAATDADDIRAPFSNYGSWVDVCAPGVGILSCRADGTHDDSIADTAKTVAEDYIHFSGTSMACPNTVGVLSLLYAKNPGRDPLSYRAALEASADTNIYALAGNSNVVGKLGSGRVNAFELMSYSNAAAYLEVQWSDGSVRSAIPESTHEVTARVGNWNVDLSNVVLEVTNVTTGISMSTNQYWIGDWPAYSTISIPSNYFAAVLSDDPAKEVEVIRFTLKQGDEVLATDILYLYTYFGNSTELLVSDLEGDGTNDIVTKYTQVLLKYTDDGKLNWFAEIADISEEYVTDFTIGDVDGDGVEDIIAAVSDHIFGPGEESHLYVLDQNGQYKEGFPVTERAYNIDYLTLADLDEDGVLDIIMRVAVTQTGGMIEDWQPEVWAYKGDGTLLWKHSLENEQAEITSVADLDHDGWPEVVIASRTPPYHASIEMISRDGTDFAPSIQLPEGMNILKYHQVVLGDLDADGDLELVASARNEDTYAQRVYAWHHDGTMVSGWPQIVPANFFTIRDVHLADIDGDHDLEVFATQFKNGMYGWSHDGTALPGFPRLGLTNINLNMVIDDITGDGAPNWVLPKLYDPGVGIFIMNFDGSFVSGYAPKNGIELRYSALCALPPSPNRFIIHGGKQGLEFIDTGFPYKAMPLAWPMARHDNQRTGACVYDTNPVYRCSFASDEQVGISNLTASFTAYVWEFDETNSWYRWDFDGNGSVDYSVFGVSTASHYYASIGDYDVSLTVSNAAGETYTRTRTNYIHVIGALAADFISNIQTAEAPIEITFTDLSLNRSQQWEWDFNGDSIIDSTQANPSYVYATSGVYTVSLTVHNNFGAGGSSSSTVSMVNYIVLTNDADVSVKYVATNGLHLYPFKNWAEAATNIQAAVDAADEGQTVLVSNGTYHAPKYLTAVEIRKPIYLRSVSGPSNTIIRGSGYDVTLSAGNGAEVSGFSIQNGRAGLGCGARIFNDSLITNCIVEDNIGGGLTGLGGGVGISEGSRMHNCIVRNNFAGTAAGVWINNNSQARGVEIFDSKIIDNGGSSAIGSAAINVYQQSDSPYPVWVRNCLISGNEAKVSIIRCETDMLIESCTIVGNRFSDLHLEAFPEKAVFHTTTNSAVTTVPGSLTGVIEVVNTVIWNNEGDSDPYGVLYNDHAAAQINYSYSLSPFTVSGPGNISADPRLIDEDSKNYTPSFSSPCINAGTNQTWMTNAVDLAGEERISQSIVDCGAYESLGSGGSVVISASQTSVVPLLPVSFSGSASSPWGAITNYHWSFGDGNTTNGPTLTNVVHAYTVDGANIAILTATDDQGNTGWDSVTIRVDGTGPDVASVAALDETHVRVVFNEKVSEATASSISHYTLNRSASILSAAYDGTLQDRVDLAVSMLSTGLYELVIEDVEDLLGNAMSPAQTNWFESVTVEKERVFFDFGKSSYTTPGNWNNITSTSVGLKVEGAVDSEGDSTEIDLRFQTTFNSIYSTGIAADIIYPASAQRDALLTTKYEPEEIRVEGLEPSKTYDFYFFSSYDPGYKAATRYTVNGEECLLVTRYFTYANTNDTASVLGVTPNAEGQVNIEVKQSSPGTVGWGSIGVMEIRYEPFTKLVLSTNVLTVPEGGTNTFGIALSRQPEAAVTVSVERISGDTNIIVSSDAELVFTTNDWMTPKYPVLTATADEDWVNGIATVRCSSATFTEYVTATEADDEAYRNRALPWSETFESTPTQMAGTLGALAGQHGWTAEAGAVVTNTDAQSGSQSLSLSTATASHTFDGAPTNIWIEFWSNPVRGVMPGQITGSVSAVFYVNTNDQIVAYSNTTPVTLNSTVSNGWNKFVIECDYVSKVWKLSLNEVPMVGNFAFYGSPAEFSAIEIIESSTNTTFLDSINITDSLDGDDTDGDGLPDTWETIYFGDVSPDPLDLASNGVNTVLGCYIAGIDPTDPDAFFKLSNVRNILGWNAASGRVYTIYWTSNLLSGFGSPLTNDLPWMPAIFTDTTHSAEGQSFYKIEVQLDKP